jgi:hypothetical protein
MFGNSESMVDKLKSLDVYRKMPKNYMQPTFIGAVGKIKIILPNSLCVRNNLYGFIISP